MRVALVSLVVLLAAVGVSAGATPRLDRAIVARDILPPGNYGGVDFQKTSQDQAPMYDALTPLTDRLTAKDITSDFKAEPLWTGSEKAVRTEHPGRGVRILRDSFDVPHVFGKTEAAVFYGSGYAAAEDRGVLMELARWPGRLACVDAPGFNAFAVALSGEQFKPSAQTEAILAQQIGSLSHSAMGRQELKDIDAYVAGINEQHKVANLPIAPWTRNDVVAMTCLLGARFGAGGGDEARRAEFYAALQAKLGAAKGASVFADLSERNDPGAPTTLAQRFPYGPQSTAAPGSGNAMVGDATVVSAAPLRSMSNAVLVSAKRSATGHPIMVAGPQLGYFYPEFFWEVDMEGGGVHVRGGSLAGIPNVLIGRGRAYGWSFTSSQSDNIDTFASRECGSDHMYVYKGACRSMTQVQAGTIVKNRVSTPVTFWQTVYGPVIGYGRIGGDGDWVALSSDRSTRGRELNAALDVYTLSTGRMKTPQQFVHDLSRFEMSFNSFYVDAKHIAYVSCGRLPLRAPDVDPAFPTLGDGAHDWHGFLAPDAHPHAIDPPSGVIVNWNNKPAPGFSSADDNFSYGSVHRSLLLSRGVAGGKQTVLSLVRTMNRAATQDLRAVEVWPVIVAMLQRATAPRAQQLADEVTAWSRAGAHRLDLNGDGKVDDPGAGVLDAAWPKLADAVLSPVLGPLTDRLAALMERDDHPNQNGSAFIDGWYGYVDKDLSSILGTKVAGAYANRYCGGGDAVNCAKSLWAVLDSIGTPPLADANAERIHFAPGFLPVTMRWTNRPTYQQILSFR